MLVNFRRARCDHTPLNIDSCSVEIVQSTKFLWAPTFFTLWRTSSRSATPVPLQRKHSCVSTSCINLGEPPPILTMFYRRAIETCAAESQPGLRIALPWTAQPYNSKYNQKDHWGLCSHFYRDQQYLITVTIKVTSIMDDPTHPSLSSILCCLLIRPYSFTLVLLLSCTYLCSLVLVVFLFFELRRGPGRIFFHFSVYCVLLIYLDFFF